MNINDRHMFAIPKKKHYYVAYCNKQLENENYNYNEKCDIKYNVHDKLKNIYQLRELIGGDIINVNKFIKIARQYLPDVSVFHQLDAFSNTYEGSCENKINICKYHLVRKSLNNKILNKYNLYSKLSPFFVEFEGENLLVAMYYYHNKINIFIHVHKKTKIIVIPNKVINLFGCNKKITIQLKYGYRQTEKDKHLVANASFFCNYPLILPNDKFKSDILKRLSRIINRQLRPKFNKCKNKINLRKSQLYNDESSIFKKFRDCSLDERVSLIIKQNSYLSIDRTLLIYSTYFQYNLY